MNIVFLVLLVRGGLQILRAFSPFHLHDGCWPLSSARDVVFHAFDDKGETEPPNGEGYFTRRWICGSPRSRTRFSPWA
ncbi:MAG: hypothetical protein DLM67_04695 [Candidatus Nephthysia bennettiae]|nr:MAG: hypothetical protein DLM67_04695 [Candidatus Dormibacteraeota bacterium]